MKCTNVSLNMSSQSAVSEVPASPSEPAAKSSKSPDKSSESIVKDGEKKAAAQSIQQFASTAMAPFKSKIIPKDFVEDRQITCDWNTVGGSFCKVIGLQQHIAKRPSFPPPLYSSSELGKCSVDRVS